MRQSGQWFEFKGVRNAERGAALMDGGERVRAEARGRAHAAAGRDGDLWMPDGASEVVELRRRIRAPRSKLDGVAAWLRGSGLLRFSSAPDRAWDARAVKEMRFRQVVPGRDPIYEGDVTWTCQPLRLLYPEAAEIAVSASGTLIQTQGTAPARPRVEIRGSGDFQLTIGRDSMFFEGIQDGVIVDSQLMDALTLDGAGLLNNRVGGDFFEIDPAYPTYVSWILDEGASVSGVRIAPRWRFY